MHRARGARIAAVGAFVPPRIVTNEELAAEMLRRREELETAGLIDPGDLRREQFEADSSWITLRTGVKERRRAASDLATSDLAAAAAAEALCRVGLAAGDLNFIIVATVTPDYPASPPTAALVQRKLDGNFSAERRDCRLPILVTDVTAACSSFLAGLAAGYGLVRSGLAERGVVVGADVMSRVASRNDRAIYPLMGDGAGCFLLERTIDERDQFSPGGFLFGADGSLADLIMTPVGGSRHPLDAVDVSQAMHPYVQNHTLKMEGRKVFKLVVALVAEKVIPAALARAGVVSLELVDAIVFHQANLRMIEAVAERLDYRGVVYNNIERLGNTSSAAIPLCFAQARSEGAIRDGMTTLLVTFGGGITWGTCLLRL